MDENTKLNNKYQKIDLNDDTVGETDVGNGLDRSEGGHEKSRAWKPAATRQADENKKQPKEKKAKEPKPQKEKKVKEPKPPKEKKLKKSRETNAGNGLDRSAGDDDLQMREGLNDRSAGGRGNPSLQSPEQKPSKEKKVKEPKVKKEKPPKPEKPKKEKKVKEKKVKEPKPEKPKKEKKIKEPKQKKPREPFNIKDFATIIIALLAVLLVAGFFALRHFSDNSSPDAPTESTTGDKMASIQIAREGVGVNLVQSDIPDVFYGFSGDYKLQYYQYRGGKMVPVQSTGKLTTSVDMGNETLPVEINYVQLGGKLFGIGFFRADKSANIYFYDKVVFKLTNLPKAFAEDGKALLLASVGDGGVTKKDVMWSESFTVDLASGKNSRFLKIINRTIDMNGAGVQDFCILPEAGYKAESSFVPFLTAREYEAGSGKQDIFIKQGSKETLFASDIYGKFFLTEGESVIFMRKRTGGFDVVKKTGDSEELVRTFYGLMSADYLHSGDYIFGKNDGKLYNLRTGEEKTVVGYRMTPEMMAVSPDGKYLVMLGNVQSVMDYQVHIFNLETGAYTKHNDKNYSNHFNLTFVDNKTAVYAVLDPNQMFEYVAIDVTKAE